MPHESISEVVDRIARNTVIPEGVTAYDVATGWIVAVRKAVDQGLIDEKTRAFLSKESATVVAHLFADREFRKNDESKAAIS